MLHSINMTGDYAPVIGIAFAIPMQDAIEGVLGNLTPDQMEVDMLNLIFGKAQVVQHIPAANTYFMENDTDAVSIVASGLVPQWIDEGTSKPSDAVEWTQVALHGKELSLLTAISDRLLRDSPMQIESTILKEASKGYANTLDAALLGTGTPAVWGNDMHTAAIAAGHVVNGVTADVGLLFSAMLTFLEAHDIFERGSAVWFVSPTVWGALRDARDSNGRPLFVPDPVNMDGVTGKIYGIEVQEVQDAKFAGADTVVLADLSKCVFGKRFGATQYATDSTAAYTVGGTLRSAFEKNETVYKWYDMYGFNIWFNDGYAICSGVITLV